MKKYLLFALLLSGLMTSAQIGSINTNCKTYFKYVVNDMMMSPVAATAINFYDKSEVPGGAAIQWFWDFGDGTTSREQNPMHSFLQPVPSPTTKLSPYRTVSLTILTSDSCKSLYAETINIMDGLPAVTPACTARYKYYQMAFDSISHTAAIQFNNYSEGDSLSYFWQFENGMTSTEKEPIVKFDLKQPTYKVCLMVSGKNSCSDMFCDAVYVTDPNQPVIDPVECQTAFGYAINYKIQTYAPALVLDFYSKASPDAAEWSWNFDDGTSSTEQNPTHIFALPLVKDSLNGDPNPFRKVCLTVKTVTGCLANSCQMINIYMNTTPPVEPGPQCHAWIKYYPATDVVSIPEVIPYKLIDASEGKVIRRLWQFEDGTTRTEAEPMVTFDFMKPTQKVCLTIFTADSCSSTWCETITVSGKPDSIYIPNPVRTYNMRYLSSYPPEMSACGGYVKAEVFLNDTLIQADKFVWSNGATGQEVRNLCPTQIYSVKATTIDGTVVSGTFLFNSDGTVTEAPYNWWVSGVNDNPMMRDNLYKQNYIVEWKLCDGTMIRSDSIPRNSANCGTEDATLFLKDAAGNVVYSANVSLQTFATSVSSLQAKSLVKLFPNPVTDVLNISWSGTLLNEMQLEILDISGKNVLNQKIYQVETGQNISLNVISLPKGVYLCKMVSGKRVIGTEKFIK